jgi:hypothetical protein
VFTRRATTEVVAGNQDFAVAGSRIVKRKIRTLCTVLVIAEVVEQRIAETFPGGRREKARRYDLIGIDIPDRQYKRS